MQELRAMKFTCWAIQFIALAAVLVHLIAGLFLEEMAWSVWPYTVLPVPLGWLAGLAVASLALPPVNDAVGRWFQRLEPFFEEKFGPYWKERIKEDPEFWKKHI